MEMFRTFLWEAVCEVTAGGGFDRVRVRRVNRADIKITADDINSSIDSQHVYMTYRITGLWIDGKGIKENI